MGTRWHQRPDIMEDMRVVTGTGAQINGTSGGLEFLKLSLAGR